MKDSTDYDAIVIGAGPNGLAAAITMQQQGLSVLLLEGADQIGGGMRTAELTLPGFYHDVCSAIQPMAVGSPLFKQLPLKDHGLQYIHPPVLAAHPFDDGTAAAFLTSFDETAKLLGRDEIQYRRLFEPLLRLWPGIGEEVLGPLRFPRNLIGLARFAIKAPPSAKYVSKIFKTDAARGLWAGLAAHSLLPLSAASTSAVALVLAISGHVDGWPIVKGGSQRIAEALAAYLRSLGGHIETGVYITSFSQLPSAKAVLFDVTPKQLLQIAGHRFSPTYRDQLLRYRYGAGVFKMDWALDGPVPFTAEDCRRAGTVHLGGTIREIEYSEGAVWKGKHPENPFVLLAQQSLFDDTRAPEGKHTVWAYCHVPHGSTVDMTEAIEGQIERFAPGFRDRILARHTYNTAQLEAYNPNYVGGDIIGGRMTVDQLFTRPALRLSPYRTSARGLYICSSSTPPGGGVHGMNGYHAARRALKDIFRIEL